MIIALAHRGKTVFLALLIAISSASANASPSIVALSADGSSASYTGTGTVLTIARTIDDAFAYDPHDFGSTNPFQGSLAVIDNGTDAGFHGSAAPTHFLRYTLEGGAITATVDTHYFVVDLWGRLGDGNSDLYDRDNNFTVALYNGNYITPVATSENLSILEGSGSRLRTEFYLADGVTFDRFEIRAANTPYFTIMETRAATRSGGTYASWADSVFTVAERADPAISGEQASPAKDGISNLMKYALALNPKLSSNADMPGASVQNSYLTLTYRKNKLADDVTYTVQADDSLTFDNWITVTTVLSQTDEGSHWLVTVQDSVPQAGHPTRFMRLQVEK